MPTELQYVTYAYIGAFVDELVRGGVRNAVLCPGSRSTPLAMVLADRHDLKLWMHLDERSAAFFALGYAKAKREPVILVCTSGTAAANFLPAVVEAHYSRVPLIVITADRPPELREVGAPQTIDQLRLYGVHAKFFAEMALPEATPESLRYIRAMAVRVVAESLAVPAGPVHLNFPFREPLVPLRGNLPVTDAARDPANQPYTAVAHGLRRADPTAIKALASDLSAAKRGLIICGPQNDPDFPQAVARLADALGYPILADPLSQVRCGTHRRENVISSYDAFLRDSTIAERLKPQVILRFGQIPTSKPVLQYMQRHADSRQILIDTGWNDPSLLISDLFDADPRWFCEDLADNLEPSSVNSWLDEWRGIENRVRWAVDTQLATYAEVFEGGVFAELAGIMPDHATLFASSSMPVRDLDTFFTGSDRAIRFLANRGANGIDGVVSSALGANAASDDPLVLVIGDLAFYHDMNGLMAAKLHGLNATIILVNNDGGGIFSFLPQADYPEHFEQLYGTPHGLDFRFAAALYSARYVHAQDWASFREAVAQGIASGGLNIIEVQTNRDLNVKQHRAVWKAVSESLAEYAASPSR